MGEDAAVAATTDRLVEAVTRWIEHPAEADALGLRLQQRCQARYSPTRVGGDFTQLLAAWIGERQKAAH